MKNLNKFKSIATTGYLQVLLVVANTNFIAKGDVFFMFVCSFGIGMFWSHNVKKIAFGDEYDRIVYSAASALGGLTGFYLSNFIKQIL